MNLATLTQAPSKVVVGDRSFLVGPLRYLDLGVIQRHLDELKGESVVQVGDGLWVDVLFGNVESVAFFLELLFRKHNPGFGEADLIFVMDHIGPRQIGPLFDIAMENPVRAVPAEGDTDPKSEAVPSIT